MGQGIGVRSSELRRRLVAGTDAPARGILTGAEGMGEKQSSLIEGLDNAIEGCHGAGQGWNARAREHLRMAQDGEGSFAGQLVECMSAALKAERALSEKDGLIRAKNMVRARCGESEFEVCRLEPEDEQA